MTFEKVYGTSGHPTFESVITDLFADCLSNGFTIYATACTTNYFTVHIPYRFADGFANCFINCILGFEFDSKILPFGVFKFVQSLFIFVFQLVQ